MNQDCQVSDDELMLAAEGELTAQRRREVRAHLETCNACRSRLGQLESVMADFAASYRSVFNPQLPPQDGSAGKLRQALRDTELPAPPRMFNWKWAASAAAIILGILLLKQQLASQPESDFVPNPSLTPGETTLVSRKEVCEASAPAGQQAVPEALRIAVFREYGIKNARDDYEVDFLITPELGGSASIKNLWPQPYATRAWNAHVKDALEKRLHTLVCSGDLDLSTAQRELATNWVGAYKKYVQRDRPM